MNLIFAVMNDGARCFLGALPPAIDVPEWAASRKKAFKILDIAEIEYMSASKITNFLADKFLGKYMIVGPISYLQE